MEIENRMLRNAILIKSYCCTTTASQLCISPNVGNNQNVQYTECSSSYETASVDPILQTSTPSVDSSLQPTAISSSLTTSKKVHIHVFLKHSLYYT